MSHGKGGTDCDQRHTAQAACNCPYKYAEVSAASVVKDLRLNHNRAVAKAYVQTVADAVAAVAMGFGREVELPCATTAR